MLRLYRVAIAATVAIFFVVGFGIGAAALLSLAFLAILEVSFSFDNATVNAKVLERLSDKWQYIFMTVGILIAVGFMRLLFPILVVFFSSHLGFGQVIQLAAHNPHEYGQRLQDAHPLIAMFGGTFLLLIFLNFIFEEKDPMWLRPIERRLAAIGKVDYIAPIITLVMVYVVSEAWGGKHSGSLFAAGVLSTAIYLTVEAFAGLFDEEDDDSTGKAIARTGMAAFSLFVYLEFQDAAFSFDGVSGAFAISDNPLVIAAGLGIGALFVRSMTIQLVRSKTLAKLPYLDHGAHWAIGTLAVCLLITIKTAIPDYVTGLIGVFFIAAAVIYSLRENKQQQEAEATQTSVVPVSTSA